MKKCVTCQAEKPYLAYTKSIYADGYKTKCKECVQAYNRAYYQTNREKIKNAVSQARKENPELDKLRKKIYHQKNAEKVRAKVQLWKKQNPEKVAKNNKIFRKRHPERIANNAARRRKKIAQNGIFQILNKELKAIYASKCFYCGATESIEMDHVIPISRGGRHSIGNLVPACKTCNLSKRDKLLIEWKAERWQ